MHFNFKNTVLREQITEKYSYQLSVQIFLQVFFLESIFLIPWVDEEYLLTTLAYISHQ